MGRPRPPLAARTAIVPVRQLLEDAEGLRLRLLAGRRGLAREIHMSRVQRPGLALTGYTDYIRYGRVQIVGASEIGYLRTLRPIRRRQVLAKLARCRISCFVVTKGLLPPSELLEQAEARGIPVLLTPTESTPFVQQLLSLIHI